MFFVTLLCIWCGHSKMYSHKVTAEQKKKKKELIKWSLSDDTVSCFLITFSYHMKHIDAKLRKYRIKLIRLKIAHTIHLNWSNNNVTAHYQWGTWDEVCAQHAIIFTDAKHQCINISWYVQEHESNDIDYYH